MQIASKGPLGNCWECCRCSPPSLCSSTYPASYPADESLCPCLPAEAWKASRLEHLAGVQTRVLNQAVKRNIDRFPEDFMFRLTGEEAELSRSQSVILNLGRGQNIKYLPHAFTEHGAIQAANILSSPRAVAMGVYVVRAFVQLREVLASNEDLAQKLARLERSLVALDLKTQRQFKEVTRSASS
jgi:hypothetical protein